MVKGVKMAKNKRRRKKMSNVIDFNQKKNDQDLCIFIQRKLAFALAQRIKQIHKLCNIGVLILIYLSVIVTYIAIMQLVTISTNQQTNKTETIIKHESVPSLPPNLISVGY